MGKKRNGGGIPFYRVGMLGLFTFTFTFTLESGEFEKFGKVAADLY